jgi:DNA polymerase III delta prime subunit
MNKQNNTSIPWVEKYRPTKFDDIVLDKNNRAIMENIIKKNKFPNLLFYGPPGTGKTTTIINLINSYQEKYNQKNKGLMINLNASDERGIDIVRNQISQFVNSKSLFVNNGMKFIILDEVDYMTKNAQYALKYLIQSFNTNVRFCLICNYISRIDESLQNEFMRLRFNQLPELDIIEFINTVNIKENLNIPRIKIEYIQKIYKSDIRSMINYIQSNQNIMNNHKIINNEIWNNLIDLIKNNDNYKNISSHIESISIEYNIEIKNIIKDLLNYIIRYKKTVLSSNLFDFVEYIMHNPEANIDYTIKYTILNLHKLFNEN